MINANNTGVGIGVAGSHSATTGTEPGISGVTNSISANAVGVFGNVNTTSAGGFSAAVRGINEGTGITGLGVWGSHDGSGWDVYGTAVTGRGVYGKVSGNGGIGVGAEGSGSASSTALSVTNGALRISGPAFIHTVTAGNLFLEGAATRIDNPYTDNNPDAILHYAEKLRKAFTYS